MGKKIVYQIYVPSFKDTTNNGLGDLQGIIEKLPYLKALGVQYLWLTPFFKSPFKDNGYDVQDYYHVDEKFGNDEDLITLIQAAQKYHINIMLDMVFNHTSTAHKWFQEWLKGNEEYRDFYIAKHAVGKAPTNWLSKFGGSAWEEYQKDHWYLHLFDQSQADLNWDNVKVRNKLKQVLRHYITLGVKGFRFDVINLISKHQFIDDPVGDGRSFYTDGPRAHEYIEEIAQEFPNDEDFLTVGELSSTSLEHAMGYANSKKTQLDSVFTFHHLKVDHDHLHKFVDKKPDLKQFNDILDKWWTCASKNNVTLSNFLNNHDQPRSVSRFIDPQFHDRGAKLLFALMASLPGNVYIFQGEEIAMSNAHFTSASDYQDVETINYLKTLKSTKVPQGVLQKSRDNARTPMQWNDEQYGGFSNHRPWIKVNDNYQVINAKRQALEPNSVLNFYKNFIKFIKQDVLLEKGDLTFKPFKNNVIAFIRKYHEKEYHFIFSFNKEKVEYNFSGTVLQSNTRVIDNQLQAYQFVIIRS